MSKKNKSQGKSRQPQRSQAEQIDRELAARALKRRAEGEDPTRDEVAALRRFEKAQDEERRWQIYESIPQKHWREMSGKQVTQLKQQAARYGIPFGDAKIRLPDVVFALHDFLAKNARKLAPADGQGFDPRESPDKRRYRAAAADLLELDLAERRGKVLPRAETHAMLGRVAGIIRATGETLQRLYGPEAHAVLDEALDDAEHEIRRFFGNGQEETGDKTG